MANEIDYKKNICSNFFSVAPGVWGLNDVFVNVYMILNPFDGSWVLVDSGLKRTAPKIKKMARQIFGKDSRPSSIILTHGHFDHAGAALQLATEWQVPVFAHNLEVPFLSGNSSYPPGDPTVGGGLMSLLSFLYPTKSINLKSYINVLPENEGVPSLPEWKVIHTPGHTPGHISLYRESDGVLIAGDAVVTTKSESALSVAMQTKKLCGPPKYFTTNWLLARQSVKTLLNLQPEIIATGHGKPMYGNIARRQLQNLSEQFYEIAMPLKGRYVYEAALFNNNGIIYLPPNNINMRSLAIKVLSITAFTAAAYVLFASKKKSQKQKDALAYEIW